MVEVIPTNATLGADIVGFDINNTTEIHSVYKGGVWIDRAALDVPANQH